MRLVSVSMQHSMGAKAPCGSGKPCRVDGVGLPVKLLGEERGWG